ncbi:MAG: SAM-dependent methyltransferase [Promethearchaeota archaeon]
MLLGISLLWPVFVRGAPWSPTPRETARKMLQLANVTQDDTVVDLGSGDGRIIIMAAEEFGAKAIGIEIDPLRILWSRRNVQRKRLQEKVQVISGNFFDLELSNATVVTVFQRIGTNNRLKAKLTSELNPGTRVVSYMHRFEGWSPVKKTEDPAIFLYIV